jgi:hypothetical protein
MNWNLECTNARKWARMGEWKVFFNHEMSEKRDIWIKRVE